MTIQTRPDNQVFASGANPGEVALFPDILRGWGVTLGQTEGKPPMEWMNGVMQRFDQGIQYTLQRGIPEWHTETDYPSHAVVQYGGLFYVSVTNNIGTVPGTDAEKWGLFWDGIPRLRQYAVTPTSNLGDIHVNTKGAMTWDAEKGEYKPLIPQGRSIIGGGLGAIHHYQSRAALLEDGAIPLDGDIWSGDVYPVMWKRLQAGLYATCSESEWQSSSIQRKGCYVINLAEKTFRCPDLNGKKSGSVAQFLRGDGNKSVVTGNQKNDQMQRITGRIGNMLGRNASIDPGVGSLYKQDSEARNWLGTSASLDGCNIAFDSALSPGAKTGDETHPAFTSIVYGTFFGDVAINFTDVDIAALHSQYVLLNGTVTTLKNGFQSWTSADGNSGWFKYPCFSNPSGYILEQWVYGVTSKNPTTTFSFPIAFPNKVLGANVNEGNATWMPATAVVLGYKTLSLSTYEIAHRIIVSGGVVAYTDHVAFFVRAVGY